MSDHLCKITHMSEHTGEGRQRSAAEASIADAACAGAFVTGLLFADLVFAGLADPPSPGAEVWSDDLVVGPGGIANFAVALRRLGTPVALAAVAGDDLLGRHCWSVLAGEGIDLERSRLVEGWSTPVTVALAYAGDRALVTHGSPPPIAGDALVGTPPRCAATAVHLEDVEPRWLREIQAQGTLVFGDVGWDPSGRWSGELLAQLGRCHAFTPNATEAMRYTGTSDPADALDRLAELVPLAVVTCGADGAMAVDSTTGERATVPGLSVRAIDPTGAGDVFTAALIHATLAGWPLAARLAFANLTAALSTERAGGALGAPRLSELGHWWRQHAPHVGPASPLAQHAVLGPLLAAGLAPADTVTDAPTDTPSHTTNHSKEWNAHGHHT